jgi:site-specific DNA recombinase
MKAAATYARVSSEQQKEENTIASQTAALIEFAREQGYGVPDEWVVEDEGFSGASLLRPGLERLRDLAAEGHIQAVLIHTPDRLSRKYAYQVLLTEEFARHGVETIFLKAPHSGTPEDQLMLQFQGMIAEYERAQILERSRRGKRHRAKAGEVSVLGGAPYGYRYIRKTRDAPARYEIDAVEAEVVRLVYDMYTVKGLSIGAIARLLRETGPPTRRRVTRWERSVVWAILRNPAYKGAACFNKTQVGRRQKVTRPFRLSGRAVHGEKSCSHERPRDEWIEIPVPAIVSDEAFALAAERLADNKRFAPRRTIEPSIVQGLVSCRKCGYALSRTSTRSSARKIHYYRCLGSDAWRHLGGSVCDCRPIRQDLLDQIVWQEVVRLIEDPTLIQAELDRRLDAARGAEPTKRRQDALERELTRIRKSVERLVTAYQEDLLPLDELRRRMPELRAREQSARAELQAILDQAADRMSLLRLAETLTAFLQRLHESAQSLEIADRQKIVRLLVKDILVDNDTITIRHSIPSHPRTPPPGTEPPSDGKSQMEGEGYLLRSGSDHCALRRAPCRRPPLQPLQDVGLQPAADQIENSAVADLLLDPRQQPIMRDRVEIGGKVCVYDVGVAILDQPIDFPQRVMASAPRAEAVAPVAEPRFENRFDHEPDGLLDDAILNRRNAQRPRLALALRNVDPFDGLRAVGSLPQRRRQLGQIAFGLRHEPLDALPIHARRAFVGPDLRPGRRQRLGREHLIHQTEPFAAFDAVAQRRQHAFRPDRGFGPRKIALSLSALCSLVGTPDGLLPRPVHRASPFLPTFPRTGLC